jgi:hypothetical protein
MHEILDYNRFYVYRVTREGLETPPKRLSNLPEEYFKHCTHAFYLSPDFQSYLDIDPKKEVFVIRDTLSSGKSASVKCEIPGWLMSAKEIASAVLRFRWVDNQSFSVVNAEGFERVFKVAGPLDDSDELGFHAVPLYKPPAGYHFYHDKPALELQSVSERLQRKYQAYKRVTLMRDLKRDFGLRSDYAQ